MAAGLVSKLIMHILPFETLTLSHKQAVHSLWNREYPASLQHASIADFDNYLSNLTDQRHYLLRTGNDEISGWAFTFMRSAEIWFAIILNSTIHRQGYGTQLLRKLQEENSVLNGWVMDHNTAVKSDGSAYYSPLKFYLNNDFSVCTDVRLETEKISAVKITWSRQR